MTRCMNVYYIILSVSRFTMFFTNILLPPPSLRHHYHYIVQNLIITDIRDSEIMIINYFVDQMDHGSINFIVAMTNLS